MKKLGKLLTVVSVAALSLMIGVATASCTTTGTSDSTGGGTSSGGNSENTQTVTKFSVGFDSIVEWDYSFVNVNAYGMKSGVGMLNLDNWGDKKLKLGDSGHCTGAGLTYTVTLDVSDSSNYVIAIAAHLIGETDYEKEGDWTYTFKGPYTVVNGAYKCEAPTYVQVALTGEFTRTNDTDFANYIPSAPWSIDSTCEDGGTEASACRNKVVPSYLIPTVFGGATFKVSGSEITEVTDINLPDVTGDEYQAE